MQEQYIRINKARDKHYYKDKAMTVLHREDGPAGEFANGDKSWWVNGKCHREDGPAIEYARGNKSWYINDKSLTEKQFNERMNPVVELTLEDIAEKFGVDVSKLKIKK